jgi:hypothetical protein
MMESLLRFITGRLREAGLPIGREMGIADAYLTARPSRDLMVVGHQQVTREWWERCHANTGGHSNEGVWH